MAARPAAPAPEQASPAGAPSVWLVLSDKAGDNTQAMVIAEALPWPCEIKNIAVTERFVLGKPVVKASLHHVDPKRSDRLEPPWPDLVITVGRRMSMVALWIQEQSKGRTKVALLGAPKGQVRRFDLAIVSEQYRYRSRPGMLRISYPLQRIDHAAIAAEAEAWRPELAHLTRPLIAVMIGGLTKEVKFDGAIATRLARELTALAEELKGTLYLTTSRRTPADVIAALEKNLPKSAVLHRWQAEGGRNPYRALLGLADRFVVTSDSLSMQMEVARLGKPLAIYRLPPGSWLTAGPLSALTEGMLGSKRLPFPFLARWEQGLGAFLDWVGSLRHHRDLMAVPRRLVEDGYAVWFGDPFRLDGGSPPDELAGVVTQIVALAETQG